MSCECPESRYLKLYDVPIYIYFLRKKKSRNFSSEKSLETLLCKRSSLETLLCKSKSLDTSLCRKKRLETLLCKTSRNSFLQKNSYIPYKIKTLCIKPKNTSFYHLIDYIVTVVTKTSLVVGRLLSVYCYRSIPWPYVTLCLYGNPLSSGQPVQVESGESTARRRSERRHRDIQTTSEELPR